MGAFRSLLSLLSVSILLASANVVVKNDGYNGLAAVNETTCVGRTFTYYGLAGYGALPSDFRDKYGDTLSTGSSIHISGWKAVDGGKSYKATIWTLPDRGWNTEGTTAYQPRIHKFSLSFTPTAKYPADKNLAYKYEDTVLLTDPRGQPLAGLDPTTTLKYPGYPPLPAASFPGDGFGGDGPGGTRGSLDPEGLVVDATGGFWISDEYGPYLYHFSKSGRMDVAVAPPASLLPLRNGETSFSSNNPPVYNRTQVPSPEDPTSGRANNQGFEGLTYSARDNALYALLQSASINNGGKEKTMNRYTSLLKWALEKHGRNPKLSGEFAVPLPQYVDPTKKSNPRTAGASAIHAIDNERFLILSRDGDFGRGMDVTKSVYRQADVFSIRKATNFKGKYDGATDVFAPGGILSPAVTPAEYCSFLDFNVNTELAKFRLLNGGEDNTALGLLNEKWEGLALVPVGGGKHGEYFLFASSDNDFITQNGFYNFGRNTYKDASGFSLESQTLVFRIGIR